MSTSTRRLAMEMRKPKPCEGVQVLGAVSEAEPLVWRVNLSGPVEYLPTSSSPSSPCPYSGRLFELLINLPSGYPYDAPASVRCLPDSSGKVPLYHPSVNETTGEFCTGLWDKSWQETWWLSQFGQHLRSHLAQPQEGGENAKASAELMGDLAAFEAKARAACSNLRVEEGSSSSSSSSSSSAAGGGGGGGGSS